MKIRVPFGRFCLQLAVGLLIISSAAVNAQSPISVRRNLKIPDISGYHTLKCDFHMHTVFSDGRVWPSVRVQEAWSEGLDGLAITDHLEYQPHKDDIKPNPDRPHEIIVEFGTDYDIVVVKGVEVTKTPDPVGHYNALFLSDVAAVEHEDHIISLRAAKKQGAFIFWNHPGWRNHDNTGRAHWHMEQTAAFEAGLMDGIEIVNGREYYPAAFGWALEKNLTLMGTTDIHSPIAFDYAAGEIRPHTFVFSRDKTAEGVKEALLNRRTAVVSVGGQDVYGQEIYLRPLFDSSVEVLNSTLEYIGHRTQAVLHLRNKSDLPLRLVADGKVEGFAFPDKIVLAPDATVVVMIKKKGTEPGLRTVKLPYLVQNFHITPEQSLHVSLAIEIKTTPEDKP